MLSILLAHRIPKGIKILHKSVQRSNGCTIEKRDDYVLKRIPVANSDFFPEKFDYLDTLYYSMLKERVSHVIERIAKPAKNCEAFRLIELKLKPCGLPKILDS